MVNFFRLLELHIGLVIPSLKIPYLNKGGRIDCTSVCFAFAKDFFATSAHKEEKPRNALPV